MAVKTPLKSRAVGIRNHCLAQLAEGAGLPLPSDTDVALLSPELGLNETWRRWQASHTPPTAVIPVPVAPHARKRHWRLARVEAPVLVLLIGVLALLVVRGRTTPRELENALVMSTAAPWTPVTDSVRAGLSAKLLQMGRTGLAISTSLSAGELAALAFSRSQPRQLVPLDSLESRIDSLWWVHGRIRGGPRFEMGGRIFLARRRRAQARVSHLSIDGAVVPASMVEAALARVQGRSVPANTSGVWFELPAFVANVRVGNGGAPISTRARQSP
jgi:hypothetical protein